MQKTTIVFLIASFVLLAAGAVIYSRMSGGGTVEETVTLAEKVKGNPTSTVILAEFSDFQCPACASFVPAVEEIIAAHGDKLRFEYHHFPLISIHKNAEAAARASEAAGIQGKFWEMHDILFERQQEWGNSLSPRNSFIAYAEELGLDTAAFERHLNVAAVKETVQEDMREGRTRAITGTPTFYLNGEKMQITTFEDFKAQIEVALGVREAATPGVENVEFSL